MLIWEILAKTAVAHTVTYFLVGSIAFRVFNYRATLADPNNNFRNAWLAPWPGRGTQILRDRTRSGAGSARVSNVVERFTGAGVPKERISFMDKYAFNFPGHARPATFPRVTVTA